MNHYEVLVHKKEKVLLIVIFYKVLILDVYIINPSFPGYRRKGMRDYL